MFLDTDDLEKTEKCLSSLGYKRSAPAWSMEQGGLTLPRFMKITKGDDMLVDILVPSRIQDLSIIKTALRVKSEFGLVRVATKKNIIRLKYRRGSKQDLADIEILKNDKN